MKSFDIVDLIDKNPINRLSKSYNSKFIEKIKENFTENEQQLYLVNFYCYLKYDSEIDFVIYLNKVWK